jgi:hypothetical protein
MKNKAQPMSLPKIKWMLRLRSLSLILSILFTGVTAAFLFEIQAMHWPWSGYFLLATTCILLVVFSSAGFLFLQRKLANSGL